MPWGDHEGSPERCPAHLRVSLTRAARPQSAVIVNSERPCDRDEDEGCCWATMSCSGTNSTRGTPNRSRDMKRRALVCGFSLHACRATGHATQKYVV